MRTVRFGIKGVLFLAIGLVVGTLGCGSGDEAEDATKLSTNPQGDLPPAAITPAENPENGDSNKPEKNTPEWYLYEISVLQRLTTPTEDIEKLRDFQRDRNYKIVELAKQCIQKTYQDPAKKELFETAAHHAMEAQLQLAIQVNGVDPEEHRLNGEELYENAAMLFDWDPKSKATLEAGFTLVKFAEIMARKVGAEEPDWLEEYVRQARLFAHNFPQDDGRAIAKLDAAGWSCEAHGQLGLALSCYKQIEKQFPQNPLAQHIPAVIRRLELPGKKLQLAGPTQDGNFLSIDALRNKVVLVAFWAADTKDFELDAAILKDLYGKYAANGFEIVGVNLDEDESRLKAFSQQHGFSWRNIFYIDQNKRRWNNPVVRYYGVREIPTYWLVDQQGKVVDTHFNLQAAEEPIQKLLGNQ